jgi:hypothetical protein
MKLFLKILMAGICVWMTIVTIRTSMAISLWAAWDSYAANPWAVATLWDVYFGFTIFWLWVVLKERNWGVRILWLILIYGLGNIATSAYVFLQLMKLSPEDPVEAIFRRRVA